MSETDRILRDHLRQLLRGGNAHLDLQAALANLPAELRGQKAPGLPHTVWQLLEHIRLAQWDILEYSRDRNHQSPSWPEGYWPENAAPPDAAAWDASLEACQRDLEAMQSLVADPATDLYTPLPWGEPGHTLLREALLLADHNAYHVGQIVMLRQALGAWK